MVDGAAIGMLSGTIRKARGACQSTAEAMGRHCLRSPWARLAPGRRPDSRVEVREVVRLHLGTHLCAACNHTGTDARMRDHVKQHLSMVRRHQPKGQLV